MDPGTNTNRAFAMMSLVSSISIDGVAPGDHGRTGNDRVDRAHGFFGI